MIFGSWSILAGVFCVVGFSLLTYMSFKEAAVKKSQQVED